jgi:predicted DNA-binding protein (MmcQ/YjbR family)
MAKRIEGLLDQLAAALNGLPNVSSTPQWGGRAYKVASTPSGKVKMLAFVAMNNEGNAIHVSFKLRPPQAEGLVERHDWIEPHSFRTLAPSGWLTATVSTSRQLGPLKKLLTESHTLYVSKGAPPPQTIEPAAGSGDARHIDRIMDEVRDGGWSPQSDW